MVAGDWVAQGSSSLLQKSQTIALAFILLLQNEQILVSSDI
jgi:hypothetical protein